MARLAAKSRRIEEGLPEGERAMRILDGIADPPPPALVGALSAVGALYALSDRLTEAEVSLSRALEIAGSSYGPESPRTARVMQDYAAVLRRLKRKREASQLEKQAEKVLADSARQNGLDHIVDVSALRSR
jgi:hypothetical protein